VCESLSRLPLASRRPARSQEFAGIPIHHSLPGSTNIIYIDFNGHTIVGTAWNEQYARAVYNARPYDLDGDESSFSAAEQVAMSRIWNRMAEDFAPFNVDVTTEEPPAFGPTVGRYLATFSRDAQGQPMPEASSSGVAYLGVFGLPEYHTR
jgi:hypothetical protein